MRAIEWTSRFKKDYRREQKGRHRGFLDQELRLIIPRLAADEPLSEKHRDHALTGDWTDHRDCHVKPDLVLIFDILPRLKGGGFLRRSGAALSRPWVASVGSCCWRHYRTAHFTG
jgi:mRNA interferase YafQ